jgi:hypothetical protein
MSDTPETTLIDRWIEAKAPGPLLSRFGCCGGPTLPGSIMIW